MKTTLFTFSPGIDERYWLTFDISVVTANPKFMCTGKCIIKKIPQIMAGGNSTWLLTNPLMASQLCRKSKSTCVWNPTSYTGYEMKYTFLWICLSALHQLNAKQCHMWLTEDRIIINFAYSSQLLVFQRRCIGHNCSPWWSWTFYLLFFNSMPCPAPSI